MAQDTSSEKTPSFVLKILSGPHKEAELVLSTQGMLLGRDEACDIVLLDQGLANKHLKLFLKEKKIWLEPLNGALVHVDGRLCTQVVALEDFQYILAGQTLFSVGPEEAIWPAMSEEKALALQKENSEKLQKTESQNSGTGAEEEKKAIGVNLESADSKKIVSSAEIANEIEAEAATSTDEKTGERPRDETELPAQGPEETPLKPAGRFKDQIKRWFGSKKKKWGIACFLLVSFLLLLGLFAHSLKKVPAKQNMQAKDALDVTFSINKILQQFKVEKPFFELQNEEGILSLVAYVKTSDEKTKLNQALRSLPNAKFRSIRIWSQEHFLSTAQDVLKMLKLPLYVASLPEPDSLLVKGYLFDISQLPAIKNRVFTDIFGLRKLKTNVLSSDDAGEMASSLLTKYELAGLIKVQPFQEGLALVGNIETGDEIRWKEAYKELKKTFSTICKLVLRIAIVHPQALKKSFFDSPIESVTVSKETKTAWIDLRNGERYFESSQLPSGYVVQKITPEGILLNKNGEIVNFKLEEL